MGIAPTFCAPDPENTYSTTTYTQPLDAPTNAEAERKPILYRSPTHAVVEVGAFFMDTYSRTLQAIHENDQFEIVGRETMSKQVEFWIRKNQAIRCLLPAFPCKSPNERYKVGGRLADLGELLALTRLDEFAHEIGKKYDPGCRVLIVSDGRVYADLTGRPYTDVRDFNLSVRQLANSRYIRFTELNLVGGEDDTDKAFRQFDDGSQYRMLQRITSIGAEAEDRTIDVLMDQYGVTDDDVRQAIEESPNLTAVYRGFIKFLMLDMMPWDRFPDLGSASKVKKFCSERARKMVARNMAYAKRMNERYPSYVRLSIHGHDNSNKFSVRFYKDIPKCITPWHNVTCKMLDGRFVPMKRVIAQLLSGLISDKVEEQDPPLTHPVDMRNFEEFVEESLSWDEWTHDISAKRFTEIVSADGEFWCFQEVRLYDDVYEKSVWEYLSVTFDRLEIHKSKHLGPIIITSTAQPPPSMNDIPIPSLRRLVNHHGMVVLRGFAEIDDDQDFKDCASNIGHVIQVDADPAQNHVLGFDGLQDKARGAAIIPMFSFFHCAGYTDESMFVVDSRRVLENLDEDSVDKLNETTVAYATDEGVVEIDVVGTHPVTNDAILRYHAGVDESEMKDGGLSLSVVQNDWFETDEECQDGLVWLVGLMENVKEDQRAVYRHEWKVGDFVVMDNIAGMYWGNGDPGVKRLHFN